LIDHADKPAALVNTVADAEQLCSSYSPLQSVPHTTSPVTMHQLPHTQTSAVMKPPMFEPITPIKVSERWFPKGRNFGLYESGGRVAPNVTSILGWKFPFNKSKWVKSEPDIDHDAVTSESAKRGTAVHLAMEKWLQSQEHTPVEEHLQWINPLQSLVSRASKTLAVEVPVHYSITGVGSYAGSSDGLMLVNGDVVLIDYKTKRHGKYVSPRFCEQQRLQLAAYSLAINNLYQDQLPSPVTRTSLLFAHPDDGKPVTVVSTQGNMLLEYQQKWIDLLGEWYEIHGEQVVDEQLAFNLSNS
jgi:hypothetical protein